MVLTPQLIQYNFGQGLDTKTDPKAQPSKPTTLENVRFRLINRISKRYGYTALGTDTSTVERLIPADNQVLAKIYQSTEIRKYEAGNTSTNQWSQNTVSGQLPVPQIISKRLGPPTSVFGSVNGYNINCASIARNSNYFFVISSFANGQSAAELDVFDNTTGKMVRGGLKAGDYTSSGPFRAESITNSNKLFTVIGGGTGFLTYDTYDPDTDTVARSNLSWTNCSSSITWDCITAQSGTNNYGFIAYVPFSLTNSIFIDRVNLSDNTMITVSKAISVTVPISSISIIRPNPSSTILKILAVCQTQTQMLWLNYDLTTNKAPFTIDNTGTDVRELATGCVDATDSTTYVAVQQYPAGGTTYNRRIKKYSVNSSGTVTAITPNFESGGLASKAIWVPELQQPMVWATYDSTYQRTYFLVPLTATAQSRGRILHTSGGGLAINNVLPSIISIGNGQYQTVLRSLERLQTDSGSTSQIFNYCSVIFNTTATSGWNLLDIGGRKLITGGYLANYDGAQVLENGFLLYPEIISSSSSPIGGSMTTGTYSVVCTYETQDANGNLHRSAPSLPFSVNVSGTTATVSLTVKNYCPTDLSRAYFVVPYRTIGVGGTIYYRCGTQSSSITTGGQTIVLSLTASDASIAANSTIYTTGNVEDNWQPSAPIAIAADGSRVSVLEGDKLTQVSRSKALVRGETINFYPDYAKQVPANGEQITGIANLLDRHFVFKERSVFMATGDGADNTGSNDTLSDYSIISNELGAISQNSIIQTNYGIIFKSHKGFFMIGRDFNITYIGAGVDSFNSHNVITSCWNEDTSEATFLLDNNTSLILEVFYTEQGYEYRWSVDTNQLINDVIVSNGNKVIALTTPGTSNVYQESSTSFVDPGNTGITLKNETGWITPGQSAGLMRVYQIYVLGDSQSTHTFQVDIAYDYNGYTETQTITSANATYNGSSYLFSIFPKTQLCSAIRLRISEQSPSGESYDLTGLTLRVGVRPTGALLPSQKATQ